MQDVPPTSTEMIHYECRVCDTQATCVKNAPAELAWLEHMESHVNRSHWEAWTWAVVPVPLD